MVKILNFFIIQVRTFKFWQHIVFGTLITYPLKFFCLGPPFGRQGPPNMGRKQVKRLKSISSFSFLARALIFGELVVLTNTEVLQKPDFLFRASKFSKKFPKMVKILNLFIIQARTFKFWLYIAYIALISHQLRNYYLGVPFGQQDPPKCQILTFLFFELDSSQFWNMLVPQTKIKFS